MRQYRLYGKTAWSQHTGNLITEEMCRHISLNKENFNGGEYCGNAKDVYREILPKAVSTKEGTEMKCVANSSSITGQSEGP